MKNTLLLVTLFVCFWIAIVLGEEDHGHHNNPTTPHPTTRHPTTAPTTRRAPTTARPTPPPHHGRPHHRPPPSWIDFEYTEYEQRILNVTKTLYQGLIFPNAKNIVASGVYPPGVFSANVSGRITPVGSFDDQEGTFEYFYGLAGASDIINVFFIHLIAKGNLVAVRVDLLFNQSAVSVDAGAGLQNLTQEGFITFDREGLIESYDLVILRLGEAQVSVENPAARPAIINAICEAHEFFCLGANQQYPDFATCVSSISSQNFGTWDNASSNTTTCRELHAVLVPLRPNFHCPHIGPTGGGACVDVPYDDYYLHNY